MNALRIVEIESPGSELDELYRHLLAPNFPPDQLDALDDLRGGVADGIASVLVALDADGGRLGTAVGEWYAEARVMLLGYLAVDPARRSTGIGGRLLEAALERWTDRHRPCAVVAEIDHPAAEPDEPAWGDPARRVAFYARHGARVLDVPYFQPALGGGEGERFWGMLLIALHLEGEFLAAPDRAAAAPIRRFLGDYFTAAEGGLPDDEDGRALFEAATAEDGILLLDPATTPLHRLPHTEAPKDRSA